MELIKQQMNANTFDYNEYAMFICSIMSKLCAPIRDEDIEKIKHLTDPIEVFKYKLKKHSKIKSCEIKKNLCYLFKELLCKH